MSIHCRVFQSSFFKKVIFLKKQKRHYSHLRTPGILKNVFGQVAKIPDIIFQLYIECVL